MQSYSTAFQSSPVKIWTMVITLCRTVLKFERGTSTFIASKLPLFALYRERERANERERAREREGGGEREGEREREKEKV